MIPQKVYYVYDLKSPRPFSNNPKTKLMSICLSSWTRVLEGYEMIELNEHNFDYEGEYKNNRFFKFCVDHQQYALLSDYIRTKALYLWGGFYLDTDVEVLKPFDNQLNHSFFIGLQDKKEGFYKTEPAIMGAVAGHPLLKEVLNFYETGLWDFNFYDTFYPVKKGYEFEGLIAPSVYGYALNKLYSFTGLSSEVAENQLITLKEGEVTLYPPDYFCPNWQEGRDHITARTITLHWNNSSWLIDQTLALINIFIAHRELFLTNQVTKKWLQKELQKEVALPIRGGIKAFIKMLLPYGLVRFIQG